MPKPQRLIFVEILHACRDDSKLRLPVYCFIDSKYTINVAEGKTKARANKTLIAKMRASLYDVRRLTAVLPVHAGIIQNEIADSPAKRGAHVSSRDAPKRIMSLRNTRSSCCRELADDLPEDEDPEDDRVQSDVLHSPVPDSLAPETSPRRSKRLRPEPTPAFVYRDTPIRFLD